MKRLSWSRSALYQQLWLALAGCTCMLAMCLAIVSPRGSQHTDAAFLMPVAPDQCQPRPLRSLWADTKVGAVAWCLQIFSSRWEKQREWNVDKAMGKQSDSLHRELKWLLFYGSIIGLTESKLGEAKVRTSGRSFGSPHCQVSFVKYYGVWPIRGPVMVYLANQRRRKKTFTKVSCCKQNTIRTFNWFQPYPVN